jgi:hypothetical protein
MMVWTLKLVGMGIRHCTGPCVCQCIWADITKEYIRTHIWIYLWFMQAYPNQDFRIVDGGLNLDRDALTHQDDLPM